jgi:hypothetical protein
MDKIDPLYKNPFSRIQKLFGADIHWCPFCRLQFYDLRKRAVDKGPRFNTARLDG